MTPAEIQKDPEQVGSDLMDGGAALVWSNDRCLSAS
jgi:hypothetical protein